jgi:hypothetical protein
LVVAASSDFQAGHDELSALPKDWFWVFALPLIVLTDFRISHWMPLHLEFTVDYPGVCVDASGNTNAPVGDIARIELGAFELRMLPEYCFQ